MTGSTVSNMNKSMADSRIDVTAAIAQLANSASDARYRPVVLGWNSSKVRAPTDAPAVSAETMLMAGSVLRIRLNIMSRLSQMYLLGSSSFSAVSYRGATSWACGDVTCGLRPQGGGPRQHG